MYKKLSESLAGLAPEDRTKIIDFIKSLPLTSEEKRLIRFENYSVSVTASGGNVALSYDFDKRNCRVIGLALGLSDDAQLTNCTLQAAIDAKEVFQSGTPCRLIFAAQNVNTDARFFRLLDREINDNMQSRFTGTYTDGAVGGVPYTAKFTFMCIAKKEY